LEERKDMSGFRICETLCSKEKCFRLIEYDDGDMVEIFHEHVREHRINKDNTFVFLKTLLFKHSSFGDKEIFRTFLNSKGKKPEAIDFCTNYSEYPEPGVLRTYLSTSHFSAWVDEIVCPSDFRVQ